MDFISACYEFLINRPLVMLLLLALPLWGVAKFGRLYPGRLLLTLAALPAFLSLFLLLFSSTVAQTYCLWFLVIVDGLLILVALGDALMTVRARHFSCQRNILQTASQGKKYEVDLELINRSPQGCKLSIRDDWPASFEPDPDHFTTRVAGNSRTQFTYDFVCNQRGLAELNCVHLLVRSPLGLWRAIYQIPVYSSVNVYPDMQQIDEYDLLARTNRLSLMGLRRSRHIGQDNEFERLRDYTQDDNYKHIDWRATARRNKLTVRDFQADQSQRIVFMLDCGRMMTGTSDGNTLLDHAINAMLMLSYVALRQGDSVGLITFSDRIHNYTPARSGVQHINRLLHATYNQTANHVESRYDDAFLYLRSNCRKRSLVVLITNVIDDINALQIHQYMSHMTGQHLPLAVLLRDREMFDPIEEYEAAAQTNSVTAATCYQAAAAANVLTWRQNIIRELRRQGVLALDVFPDRLTADLVNQYLEIKARHLL